MAYNLKSYLNLTPFDEMDKETHKAISSRGGKASVEARRRRKQQREALDALLRYEKAFRALQEISGVKSSELKKMIREAQGKAGKKSR